MRGSALAVALAALPLLLLLLAVAPVPAAAERAAGDEALQPHSTASSGDNAAQELNVYSLSSAEFRSLLQARNPISMRREAARHAAMLQIDAELDEAADADAEADADVDADGELDEQLLADIEAELDEELSVDAEAEAEAEAEDQAEAAGRALVESDAAPATGAGRAAGASGKVAGASGKVAGASGKVAGASGKVAGASGKVGGASGKVSGASGKVSGASGKVSGASGKVSGASGKVSGSDLRHGPTVVQPLATVKKSLTQYSGDPASKKYPVAQRECWYLYTLFKRRYGIPQEELATFDQDLLKLCNAEWTAPDRQDRARLVRVYRELMSLKAGTPFVNQYASTKASSVSAQLQCGSCWAQAATGSFEVALKKAGKFKGDLSVQQLVDCAKGAAYPDSHGCQGGTPMDGLKYLQTHGHALESAYPYTGKQGDCKEQLGAGGPLSFGWDMLHFDAQTVATTKHDYSPCTDAQCGSQWAFELDVLFAVKNDGPFIAWVDASLWQHYTGGIFDATRYCRSDLESGNHIVELMGYGRQNGMLYWLVKNSWGNSWGDNGFIRLPMGVNACGLFNYVGRASPVPLAK